MFLKTLIRCNRPFLEAVINLHQAGKIPPNSYALDLDMLAANTRVIAGEAAKYNLKVLAMTKQIGRNPAALRVLKANGIDSCVAVDVACARPVHAAGLKVGHIGHLVQV
ncbi:MAG: YhfX family PLP-dependent enzyme, partial [Dehalococcoidia bacterium]